MFKLLYVYKSSKKQGAYLYLADKEGFEALPEVLKAEFGQPIFVMALAPHKYQALTGLPREKVIAGVQVQGFYLYIPPPTPNALNEWKQAQVVSIKEDEHKSKH